MTKAYLNALAEEGTRQELIEWLCKLDAENDKLREAAAFTLEKIEKGAPGWGVAKDALRLALKH